MVSGVGDSSMFQAAPQGGAGSYAFAGFGGDPRSAVNVDVSGHTLESEFL